MSASFFITMSSPTLHSTGVGRRRSRRDGAFAGDRPAVAPGRPGRCSAAPARTHWACSLNPTPAGMRTYHFRGVRGCRQTPPFCR